MPQDRCQLDLGTNLQQLPTNKSQLSAARRERARQLQYERHKECAAMMRTEESVEGAVALQSEAGAQVEAAVAERERGESSVSMELLLEAIGKERESLDMIDSSLETLRLAMDQRRRAIDQQQEILSELVECLNKEGK
jgi:hypothetical protein